MLLSPSISEPGRHVAPDAASAVVPRAVFTQPGSRSTLATAVVAQLRNPVATLETLADAAALRNSDPVFSFTYTKKRRSMLSHNYTRHNPSLGDLPSHEDHAHLSFVVRHTASWRVANIITALRQHEVPVGRMGLLSLRAQITAMRRYPDRMTVETERPASLPAALSFESEPQTRAAPNQVVRMKKIVEANPGISVGAFCELAKPLRTAQAVHYYYNDHRNRDPQTGLRLALVSHAPGHMRRSNPGLDTAVAGHRSYTAKLDGQLHAMIVTQPTVPAVAAAQASSPDSASSEWSMLAPVAPSPSPFSTAPPAAKTLAMHLTSRFVMPALHAQLFGSLPAAFEPPDADPIAEAAFI